MVFIGIASSVRMPTSESYITGNTPFRRRATVLGVYYLASIEASGLLTPAIGILIDKWGFYPSFNIAGIFMGVIIILCAAFMWRTRTQRT